MTLVSKSYSIEIRDNPDLGQLKSTWQKIEDHNQELSFFHSWEWINTWLSVYKPEVLLVSAKYKGRTVALGLFCKSVETRHRILKSRQLRLFQTGNLEEDQIWVEFNDFLSYPEHREQASKACLDALLDRCPLIDEIVISMISKPRAESLLEYYQRTDIVLETSTYKANLEILSVNNKDYLASLSRNTRYQINRSKRIYEQLQGVLEVSFAENRDQALRYWEEASDLHIKRWRDSGFLNPEFINFHREFILEYFESGLIDVARITAGTHLIAIIHNIIYKEHVYFYLQGIQPETDGKLKPGLTAHSMLIEHYLQFGMKSYNFMGGYSQYKKQLSQVTDSQLVIKIQKPLLKFKVESIFRNLKHKLLQTSADS